MAHNNISAFRKVAKLTTLALAASLLGLSANNTFASNHLPKGSEIVFTDSESAVLRADSLTGGPSVVSVGQKLVQPFGICAGSRGEYFVTDTGCAAVLGIDSQTGNQRIVASGQTLGMPFGIAAESADTLLVANGQSLLRVNSDTGTQAILASGGFLTVPIAVTVAANGNIFVADFMGAIVRVDARSGAQTFITSGGYLNRPQGIAVRGKYVYVTDVATADGNFGVGRIVKVDTDSGEQTVVSEGQLLVGPVGIALDQKGDLIVGDPYTINEESVDLFDGAIVRIDAVTGSQSLIARGKEGFVNPRCVTLSRSAE